MPATREPAQCVQLMQPQTAMLLCIHMFKMASFCIRGVLCCPLQAFPQLGDMQHRSGPAALVPACPHALDADIPVLQGPLEVTC